MRAAEDELAKFVRKEIAFQQDDRDERAMKLGLPISVRDRESNHSRAQSKAEPRSVGRAIEFVPDPWLPFIPKTERTL
jgi:hypothetical protein